MVNWSALVWSACATTAAVTGCQSVAGITDREVDPAWNQQPVDNYARRPPARTPGDAGIGGGARRLFAAHTMFMGTVDPVSGKDDATAWSRIGYDIDGKCSTGAQSQSDSTGVCKKPMAAQADSLEDGVDCRDNAAGKLMARGSVILSGDFERRVHQKLQLSQTSGIVLVLDDLGDGPDDPYVPAIMYVTVPTPASPPLWNGMDEVWVDPASVNGQLDKPKYVFKNGYMRNHVWVSNDFNAPSGPVPLMFYDRLAEVTPLGMTLSVQLNETNDAALRSVLSVVMDMDQVIKTFGPIFHDSVCDDLQTALIMNQYLLPNADLANGPPPFVSADKACDAMSNGTMIDWVLIKNVMLAASSPPVVSKCDAGPQPIEDAGSDADAAVDATVDSAVDSASDAPKDAVADGAKDAATKG